MQLACRIPQVPSSLRSLAARRAQHSSHPQLSQVEAKVGQDNEKTVVPGSAIVIAGETVSISSTGLLVTFGTVIRMEALGSTNIPPAVYQGHTIESGSRTIVSGATLSMTGGSLIIASGSQRSHGDACHPVAVIARCIVHKGSAMVINGATVSLNSTAVIFVSGSATRTEGLRAAELRGLGGSLHNTASSPASGTATRPEDIVAVNASPSSICEASTGGYR
jgi:hypothetical protein